MQGSLYVLMHEKWQQVRQATRAGEGENTGAERMLRLCAACSFFNHFANLYPQHATLLNQLKETLYEHIFVDWEPEATAQARGGGGGKLHHSGVDGQLLDYSKFQVYRTELEAKSTDLNVLKFEVNGKKVADKLGLHKKIPYIQKLWAFWMWCEKQSTLSHRNRLVQARFEAKERQSSLQSVVQAWHEATEGGRLLRRHLKVTKENNRNKELLYAINVSWASVFQGLLNQFVREHPVVDHRGSTAQRHLLEVWQGMDDVSSSIVADVPDKELIVRHVDRIGDCVSFMFEAVSAERGGGESGVDHASVDSLFF